jgi:hypothetical protein
MDMAWNQSKEQSSTGDAHPSAEATAAQPKEVTTIMVQNLPRRCPPAMVAAEIDRSGFAGSYDFLHVGSPSSLPLHAFVNFTSTEVAMKFKREWKQSWRFQTIGPVTKVNVVEARMPKPFFTVSVSRVSFPGKLRDIARLAVLIYDDFWRCVGCTCPAINPAR